MSNPSNHKWVEQVRNRVEHDKSNRANTTIIITMMRMKIVRPY